jgi:valyl-tRNA synthetase
VATGVAGNIKIYVFLEGMIDISGEKVRLEKEIAKVSKELAVVSRKLGNSDFKEKAAEVVIRKEEAKFGELKEKLTVLEAAIERFRSIRA